MYVTENGGAFKDALEDGRIHDKHRTDYIERHIQAVADAMQQGVQMAGYMVWSLLDNFEWAFGYEKRFGIVHVDYVTQKRTLKDSALWYQAFLSSLPNKASTKTRQPAHKQANHTDLVTSGD
jgi:beta-glucosidase